MAKNRINGTFVKVFATIAGIILTVLTTSFLWIWNARGYCDNIKANTTSISETKLQIKEAIVPKIDANSMAINIIQKSLVSVEKDIEHLDEKIGSIDETQRQIIKEQRQAFNEILKRLPNE